MANYLLNLVSHLDMSTINPPDIGWKQNGNDGTGVGLVAATNIVDGIAGGKATEFNGVNEYVDCGERASIAALTEATFALWAKVAFWDPAGSDRVMSVASASNDRLGLIASGTAADERFILHEDITNHGVSISIGTGLSLARWYHVAWTMGAAGIDCFLDGEFYIHNASTRTISEISGTPRMRIGCAAYSVSAHFSGAVDEVMIFNSALTRLQVMDLYLKSRRGQI